MAIIIAKFEISAGSIGVISVAQVSSTTPATFNLAMRLPCCTYANVTYYSVIRRLARWRGRNAGTTSSSNYLAVVDFCLMLPDRVVIPGILRSAVVK